MPVISQDRLAIRPWYPETEKPEHLVKNSGEMDWRAFDQQNRTVAVAEQLVAEIAQHEPVAVGHVRIGVNVRS